LHQISETKIQLYIEIYNTSNEVNIKIIKIMTYTSRQINRDFRLKVFGFLNGKKINMLVGVSGLLNLIGEELMEKQIARAYRSGKDVCVCKLRRGLQVSYYSK